MARRIEISGEDVIIYDGDNVTAVRIDDENEFYQQIKAETNNFTENMNVPDQLEALETTQADLVMTLMMNGVL